MRASRWAGCLLIAASVVGCGPRPKSEVDLAKLLQDQGKYDESIGVLQRLLDATPDAPEASYLLGVALVRTGRGGEAVWPLLRAAESDRYAVEAGDLLARTLVETANGEAAVRAASDVLAAAPGDATALRIRVRARLQAHEPTDALADVEAAMAVLPKDPDLVSLRGTVLAALKRNDDARRDFQRFAEMGARSGDTALATRSCLALATFEARVDPASDGARQSMKTCLDRFPDDLAVLRTASALDDAASGGDDATQLWRDALARMPDNLAVRATLAGRLEQAKRFDEAGAIWQETADRLDTAVAWELLADYQRRRGNDDAAKKALARAVKQGEGSNDELRFADADLQIDVGELDRAEAEIGGIEDPALRQLLQGRIDLARGDPKRALAALDAGILAWPDNAGARVLAGKAAAQLGDTERALSEFRAAFRVGGEGDAAGLEAARLHLALGEPEHALSLLGMYLSRHQDAGAEPYLLAARAHTTLGDFADARSALERVKGMKDSAPRLLLERAHIAERETGSAAAVAVIEAAKLDWSDATNDPVLGVLVDDLAGAGKTDRSLDILDGALASGERASLQDLRGRALLRAGRDAEARTAFERERALDPSSTRARVGLAMLAARAGNLRLASLDVGNALAGADDLDPATRYGAVRILLLVGRTDEARRQLETILREDPGHAEACAALARLLAERDEDLAHARSLAERAVRLDPGKPERASLAFVRSRLAAASPGS